MAATATASTLVPTASTERDASLLAEALALSALLWLVAASALELELEVLEAAVLEAVESLVLSTPTEAEASEDVAVAV
jgi:hypothetical protein